MYFISRDSSATVLLHLIIAPPSSSISLTPVIIWPTTSQDMIGRCVQLFPDRLPIKLRSIVGQNLLCQHRGSMVLAERILANAGRNSFRQCYRPAALAEQNSIISGHNMTGNHSKSDQKSLEIWSKFSRKRFSVRLQLKMIKIAVSVVAALMAVPLAAVILVVFDRISVGIPSALIS